MIDTLSLLVMAGLVPAIHVFVASTKQGVDARHKAGHDESVIVKLGMNCKPGMLEFENCLRQDRIAGA